MKNQYGNLILIVCIFHFSQKAVFSQQDSVYGRWIEFIEDDTDLIERLDQLTENPVNLNSAEQSEFSTIPFLTIKQINLILDYRNHNEKFKSRAPLRKILGTELYALLKPFFTVKTIQKNKGYLKQKYIHPIDPDPITQKYLGEPWSSYGKFYFARDKKLKMGMITQKDAGEQSPLDFISGYLAYSGNKWQAIAGSYHFRFGHGLAFTNPFANQKSAMVLNPLHSQKTVSAPSLSSAENSGLFGLSINSQLLKNFEMTLFGSVQHLDARTDRNSEQVIGIDYDGYHRTNSELNKKNQLTERIGGLSISKTFASNFNASVLLNRFSYSPKIRFKQPYISEQDLRRQYFHFKGDHLNQLSMYFDGEIKKLNLSGEFCTSDIGDPGYSQKIMFTEEHVKFGAVYWWLSKNFQTPHGGAFNYGGTNPQAQKGLYLAVQAQLSNELSIKAYKFFTKDLWRGYFNTLPQTEEEWLIEGSYAVSKKTFALRIRSKTLTQSSGENLIAAPDFHQTIYRLQYVWNAEKRLRLKTRIALTELNGENEDGMYLFQDIKYGLNRYVLIYSRITFFQTSSFKSALYEYENDLPGSYANYPLYGQGHKWYVMIRGSIGEHFRVWLKLRYLKRASTPEQTSLLKRELRLQLELII